MRDDYSPLITALVDSGFDTEDIIGAHDGTMAVGIGLARPEPDCTVYAVGPSDAEAQRLPCEGWAICVVFPTGQDTYRAEWAVGLDVDEVVVGFLLAMIADSPLEAAHSLATINSGGGYASM